MVVVCMIFSDKSLYDLYGKGSRQWLLDIVTDWLQDTTSKERAFLLSGVAGLGKSVVSSQVLSTLNIHRVAFFC